MTAKGNYGAAIGAGNTAAVLAWFTANPCGSARECGKAIGLSECAVGRHVKKIRARRNRAPQENAAMAEPSTLPAFNPSGSEVVATIKAKTEELLGYITANVPANRERSIAITNFEQAAMWAVKANFT